MSERRRKYHKMNLSDEQLEEFGERYNFMMGDLDFARETQKYQVPIKGNVYLYRALRDFMIRGGLFTEDRSINYGVAFGLWMITIVQIFGPVSVLFYSFHRVEFGYDGSYFGFHSFFAFRLGSNHHGISHLFSRILGLCFMLLQLLNGYYTLHRYKQETRKVLEISLLFKRAGRLKNIELAKERRRLQQAGETDSDEADEGLEEIPMPQVRWLWIGTWVNCFCLFILDFALMLMLVRAEGPLGVVMDAFGLAMLQHLDDVGGELAFLNDKWDEEFLGFIYGKVRENQDITDQCKEQRKKTWTPDDVYRLAMRVQAVLCVMIPLMFVCVEMDAKSD